MYCKRCHYDLRGQITPRCPECGTHYDVADPNSYLVKRPHWSDYLRRMLALLPPLLLTLGFPGCLMLIPSFSVGNYSFSHRMQNLRHIAEVWRERATSDPDLAAITPLQIKYAFGRRLSSFTQANELRDKLLWVRYMTGHFLVSGYMFLVYCVLMVAVTRRRLRRVSIGGCLLAVATLFVSYSSPAISNVTWRGDLRYLHDYIYLAPVSWRVDSSGPGSVIAYETSSQPNMKRLVAFHYGGVQMYSEDDFQKLATDQGIWIAGDE